MKAINNSKIQFDPLFPQNMPNKKFMHSSKNK